MSGQIHKHIMQTYSLWTCISPHGLAKSSTHSCWEATSQPLCCSWFGAPFFTPLVLTRMPLLCSCISSIRMLVSGTCPVCAFSLCYCGCSSCNYFWHHSSSFCISDVCILDIFYTIFWIVWKRHGNPFVIRFYTWWSELGFPSCALLISTLFLSYPGNLFP